MYSFVQPFFYTEFFAYFKCWFIPVLIKYRKEIQILFTKMTSVESIRISSTAKRLTKLKTKINFQLEQNMMQMEMEFVCSVCYKFLSTMYDKKRMKNLRVIPDNVLQIDGCKSMYHKKLTDSFKS